MSKPELIFRLVVLIAGMLWLIDGWSKYYKHYVKRK